MRSSYPHFLKGLVLLLMICSFSDCKKKKDGEDQIVPQAAFVTSKQHYVGGDTIKLINTSSGGDTYQWTLPNGETRNSIDLTYITPIWGVTQYLFKLDVFSAHSAKTAHTERFVQVGESQGSMIFYGYFYNDTVTISIDGSAPQQLILPGWEPLSPPSCGNPNYPVYTLDMGHHTLKVKGKGYSSIHNQFFDTEWDQSFEIKPNTCNLVTIQ